MKKKLLLVLTVLSCFTLGSCGKKVSYDEAKTFANDTWSEIELSYTKCVTKTVMEVKKVEGIYEAMFEVGTQSNEMDSLVEFNTFSALKSSFDDSYTFTISGNKMTVSKSVKAKDYLEEEGILKAGAENAEVKGKGVSEVYKFSEEGLLTSCKVTLDISFSATSLGFTISGAINMVTSSTNTYTK